MLDWIEQIDRRLFVFLNGLHADWLDVLMWNLSGKLQWIPLYLILLFLLIKVFGKSSWIIILGAGLVVLLADQFSVKLFKEVFERYRPCHNLELKDVVHLVNNKCGGRFGFVSSHAANTFGLATYLGLMLKRKYSSSLILLLLWATLVSYSRIYLGVHYPLDVIGGAGLGFSLGGLCYFIFNYWNKKNNI